MNRVETLDAAKRVVVGEREDTYGGPEDSFQVIADYWSIHLGVPVKAVDVAIMMDLLKSARLRAAPDHIDSWIDKAGYVACGAEIATTQSDPWMKVDIKQEPGVVQVDDAQVDSSHLVDIDNRR